MTGRGASVVQATVPGGVYRPARLAGQFIAGCDGDDHWPGVTDAGAARCARRPGMLLLVDGSPVQADLAVQDEVVVAVIGAAASDSGAFAADTGVIGLAERLARAWRDVRHAALDRLNGNYAVAVLDRATGEAVLRTDPFAIHPVVWARTRDGSGIVFASSVGAVRTHPLVDTTLREEALLEYLHFHMVPAPGSIYREIFKLRAAEQLRWRDGKVTVARHWQPSFVAPDSAISERELQQQLRPTLARAVQRCVSADVSCAAFLSGGLDSSSVCGVFAELGDAPAVAYSMGFDAAGYDEMDYARIAAKHFGLELRERYVEPGDVADAMMLVASHYDEPFGNSSAVPTYLCARAAADEGVTRLLAGDGGDELFAGNSRYVRQKLFRYFDLLPRPAQSALTRLLVGADGETPTPIGRLPLVSKLGSYVRQAAIGMPTRYDSYNFMVVYGPGRLLSPDFLAGVSPDRPQQLLQEAWDSAPSDDWLARLLYLDWQLTLADNDLRKVGEMCSAAGIDVRYPMLDPQMVALSTRVPSKALIRGFQLRDFYKRSMRGFLPDAILSKPKHGFGLPFGVWLAESKRMQQVVYPALEAAGRRGIINPGFVDELLRAHRTGDRHYFGGMMWVVVLLELWLSQH
jgi:asparagine synthase (glutamine-hydrolysing)